MDKKEILLDSKNYTWGERIMFFLDDGKWRTLKQIREALGIKYLPPDHKDYHQFYSIRTRVWELVKKGYINRAYPPEFLRGDKARRVAFVYQSTKKPYKGFPEFANGRKNFNELSPLWQKRKKKK